MLVHKQEDILKKASLIVSLLLALLFGTRLLFSGTEGNIWKQFINKPNNANYELCHNMIHDSLYGPYEENKYGEKINTPTQLQLIHNNRLYNQFLSLVRGVNPYAVELAVQLYPLTDAATTEDLCRSLGTIIKAKPEFFLSVLKNHEVTNNYVIRRMISMYPLEEFVDNIEGRIEETKERIRAFKKVKKSDLVELRDQCIDILSRYLIRLQKVQKEIPVKK